MGAWGQSMRIGLLFVALALLCSGCTYNYSSANVEASAFQNSSETAAADYKISANDVLQVSVFQVADLNRTAQVNGNGFITLPLVGEVPVGGKTIDQAQSEITKRLAR